MGKVTDQGPTVPRSMWTPLEDEVLIIFVEKLRPSDYCGTSPGTAKPPAWDRVAHSFNKELASWETMFPGINVTHTLRDGKSCRSRWKYHVSLARTKRGIKQPMSEEEDEFIIYMQQKLNNRWSQISSALSKRFGTVRTDNDVKNRWNSKLQKVVEQRKARGIPLPQTMPGPDTKAIQMWSFLSNVAGGGGEGGRGGATAESGIEASGISSSKEDSIQSARPCVDSKLAALRTGAPTRPTGKEEEDDEGKETVWPSSADLGQLQDVPLPLIRRLQVIRREIDSTTPTSPSPNPQQEQPQQQQQQQQSQRRRRQKEKKEKEEKENEMEPEPHHQDQQLVHGSYSYATYVTPVDAPSSAAQSFLHHAPPFSLHQSKRDRSYTPSPAKVPFKHHRSQDLGGYTHSYQPTLLAHSTPAQGTEPLDPASSELSGGTGVKPSPDHEYSFYSRYTRESCDYDPAATNHHVESGSLSFEQGDYRGGLLIPSGLPPIQTLPSKDHQVVSHQYPDYNDTTLSFDIVQRLLKERLEGGSRQPLGSVGDAVDSGSPSGTLLRSPAGKKLAATMLDEHLARRHHPINPAHQQQQQQQQQIPQQNSSSNNHPESTIEDVLNRFEQFTDMYGAAGGARWLDPGSPAAIASLAACRNGGSEADLEPLLAVNFDNLWT